jgi:spermidine synthase
MKTQIPDDSQDGYSYLKNSLAAIFLISVLSLFLEMLFIRWIGTEVRIFAYLQNTILVACFLGLGLGSFTCRKPIYLRQTIVPVLILLLLMAIPFSRQGLHSISFLLSVLDDFLIWSTVSTSNLGMTVLFVLFGLILTFFLLVMIVDTFVPMGRFLGRLLDDHPNTIWAYSINILGSLIGTWLFVLLSYLYQPPLVWFLIAFALIFIFIIWMRQDWKLNFVFLAIAIGLAFFATRVPDAIEIIWSPYQKLVLGQSNSDYELGKYTVTVNNVSYQEMIDLSPENITPKPEVYPPEMQGLSQYDIPLLLHPNPQSVLMVGTGTGNDVAGGLRNGAQKITAVEIDPAIIEMGKNYHPESPYSSPQVEIINDDARSFFATTIEKYDVIVFGLLDSHTTTAMTNARLDHYVYTIESISQAKSLLNDGGIVVLTFYVKKPYIADRIASLLSQVFDEKPIVFQIPASSYGRGGVMFVAGDLANVAKQLKADQRINEYIQQLSLAYPISLPGTTKITTDDWPYIYLESPKIPLLFYLIIVVMLLIFWYSYKKWGGTGLISRWNRTNWHFFFLGAAFLLLEVQNISKASVVLGNTWEVNAIIISGILFMALLANWLAYQFPKIPVKFAYFGLIAICLGLYFVDLAQFAFLPYFYKAIIVGSLTSLPMLFSGFVFINSFRAVEEKNSALGANLFGSLIGALLQSITFVTGIKSLLLVVAILYFCSFLTLPKRMDQNLSGHIAAEDLADQQS